MSYNYLPLDRKPLNFQQIKNLLDYDQLVSVTFDAHERILECRAFVDGLKSPLASDSNVQQLQNNIITSSSFAVGDEVPVDIVKLMLMLKIKSVSHGKSGVQIETVKRMMEMYNQGVLPVIHNSSSSPLSQLSLPLIGLGEVLYENQKIDASKVLETLNWQPVNLKNHEAEALVSGTQFTSAFGMFALKKAEHLLKFTDVIAALFFDAFTNEKEASDEKMRNTEVHSLAIDTFEYLLAKFLREINSVSESLLFVSKERAVENNTGNRNYSLTVAIDFFKIAMCGVAGISADRISKISARVNRINDGYNCESFTLTAASIVNELKVFANPSSISKNTSNKNDFLSVSSSAAVDCLRLIDRVQEVLAIELLTLINVFQTTSTATTSSSVEKLLSDFSEHISIHNQNNVFDKNLLKAISFINSYKF